jgi:exopolysaccharide biosynthesis polyprenyl glycosylphosphotransferase
VLTCCEVAADFAVASLAPLLAYTVYHSLRLGRQVLYLPFQVLAVAFAFAALIVLLLDRDGAYRPGSSLLRVRETERVLRSSVLAFLLAIPVAYFWDEGISRWVIALTSVFAPALLIAEKQLVYSMIRGLHERGYHIQRVVILGAGNTGRRVFSALARSPKLGLRPVAIVDEDPATIGKTVFDYSYDHRNSLTVISGPLTRQVLEEFRADVVIVGVPTLSRDKFQLIFNEATAAGCGLYFVPNHQAPTDMGIDYADVDGLMLASVGNSPDGAVFEVFKRAFDLVCASALLVMLSPVMLAMAVAIKLDSGGPALFRQTRVGKNGRLFNFFKFRTMYTDAPAYALSPIQKGDARITRIGRHLRRTSLDELPQLLNVIRGEMSLVGPRPEMPFIVEKYGWRERQRLLVKPGITGLWQLSADRAFLIHDNLQYDLYYIRNRNFFMDVAVLLHTAVFAMRGI